MVELSPNWMQENCYTAQLDRLMLGALAPRRGVADVASGSLLVTSGGSGLNLSVAQGGLWMHTADDDRGPYFGYNDASVTVTAAPNASGNPRIDLVYGRVYDSTYGEGADEWQLEVATGTATAGAQISNRYTEATFLAGAAALPDNSTPLAYILVPAGFAGPFVDATHILDARVSYGDGLWTPFASVYGGMTPKPAESELRYNRIGDMVTVQAVLRLNASASTNSLTIDTPLFLPPRAPNGISGWLVTGSGAYVNAAGSVRTPMMASVNVDLVNVHQSFVGFIHTSDGTSITGATANNDVFSTLFSYETTAP